MRGGTFKPRTKPYSFQGLGIDGLSILEKARKKYNVIVSTEVMSTEMVDVVSRNVDILQIGSRNMQNFDLLKRVGKTNLPVIVDPSHGTGRRDMILPMAKAAMAIGADGIMIEIHPNLGEALSDGDQSINFEGFTNLIGEVQKLKKAFYYC